jgi:restriction system protein
VTQLKNILSVLFFFVIVSIIVTHVIKFIIRTVKHKRYLKSGILLVDKMQGIEFEEFLKSHFTAQGYKAKLTNATNDYGADLVLKNATESIVVQAKRYKSKVGIKSVQEIIGAINHYGVDRGMVVTNNYFTKNAISLARSNNIELIDRTILIDIMRANGSNTLAHDIITETSEKMKCPQCGGKLISKKGQYGSFIGCSNYPKCTFKRT